jgi:hypothetical protein
VIARATCAALALVAGSLVTQPAAAQPTPEPAAPSPEAPPPPPAATTPPLWAPSPSSAQAPYGYVPIPIYWRDGAWHRLDDPPPEPLPAEILTTRDPLLPGGVTLASVGVLGAAIGVGLVARGGAAARVCGLSGCLKLPDTESQNNSVALLAGSLGMVAFGGAIALAGARGEHRARRSEGAMMVGMILTVLGTGAAIGGIAAAAGPYPNRASDDRETLATGYYAGGSGSGGTPVVLSLVALTCLSVGIPIWAVAGRARRGHRSATIDASTLDLLPFAGGASVRWTR